MRSLLGDPLDVYAVHSMTAHQFHPVFDLLIDIFNVSRASAPIFDDYSTNDTPNKQ